MYISMSGWRARGRGPNISSTLLFVCIFLSFLFIISINAQACIDYLYPESNSFPAAGGDGEITVVAVPTCSWTALSGARWVTIISGSSGQGKGSITYKLALNTGAVRETTINVNGQIHTITQQAATCSIELDPTSASYTAGGGAGSFTVTSPDHCRWTATTTDSWIIIESYTGSGAGSVQYSVVINEGTGSRSGEIDVEGQTFTVTQGAAQDDWVYMGTQYGDPGRSYHAMAYAGDGRVLLFGGEEYGSDFDDSWLLSSGLGFWSLTGGTTRPGHRSMHAMAYIGDDHVLLFGGYNQYVARYDDTWIYNRSSGLWTEVFQASGSHPTNRRSHKMAYIGDDKALLYGGETYINYNYTMIDETWVYDRSDNTWTQMNPESNPGYVSSGAMMAHIGGDKALLLRTGASAMTTWIYDFSDNTWTQMNPPTSPPTRRDSDMAYIGDGKVVIYGGITGVYPSTHIYRDTWVYDIHTNTWTEDINQTNPPGVFAHALCETRMDGLPGRAVLYGGYNYSAEEYNAQIWAFGGGDYVPPIDADGDGYPEEEDCDDGDNTVYPGATEICDGKDNDCDAATDDGAGELWIGVECDGPDSDLCDEGVYACIDGLQVCTDLSSDDLEVCDGIDNDCNPVTADGSDETWLGLVCDGPDSDLCMEGEFQCVEGQQICSDTTDDTVEICDNQDNDCDGDVDEGLPMVTVCYDNDGDGFGNRNISTQQCGVYGDYVADCTDCDDTDNDITGCNTPPGDDPVTVTDPDTGFEITYPGIAKGGETTIEPSAVGNAPPPNFQVSDVFAQSYFDINCTAADGTDCEWEPPLMICFTWEEGDIFWEEGLRIFQEDETGNWEDVTCTPGFLDCPESNPDVENNRICGHVDHLSWFALFENIGLTLNLNQGINFVAYTGIVPTGLTAYELLKKIGPPEAIERLIMYSPINGNYSTCYYDLSGNPSGENYPITSYFGMQAFAKQPYETKLYYESACGQGTPLFAGRSEVGFNCVAPSYTSFQFLSELGFERVISIQRFNPENGMIETASISNGLPSGVDFEIKEGEGYTVFMKTNYVWP